MKAGDTRIESPGPSETLLGKTSIFTLLVATSPPDGCDWIKPGPGCVCRRRVQSPRELSGTQPEGALMKVTLPPCREVKLLHLATTTWCHTAGPTVGCTTALISCNKEANQAAENIFTITERLLEAVWLSQNTSFIFGVKMFVSVLL